MYHDHKVWVGLSGEEKVYIYPQRGNRHGLIAGATGTGKTITLKVLAESFSDLDVPVFLADVWIRWDLEKKDLIIILIR